MRHLILFLIAFNLSAQLRFPYRAAPIPAIDPTSYYSTPAIESDLNLAPGEGRVNQYGVCIAKYTPTGVEGTAYVNDYSAPSPVNPADNWVILLGYPAGGRFIQWIGEMSIPSNTPGSSCSIPVGTPRVLPGVPTGVGNLAWRWHPGNTGDPRDDYKFFVTAHPDGTTTQQLWMMSCDPTNPANKCNPANAAESLTTNWVWTLIKDFSGSDGQGPYLDWTNPSFCNANCATTPAYWPASSIALYLLSTDGNGFVFSLRRGSKDEHGLCQYKISDDTFVCSYLDAYGEMTNGTPPLPTCHKGGGGVQAKDVVTSSYWGYQMNGAPDRAYCVGIDKAMWYRAAKSTTRVGRFVNPISINGDRFVEHGAATNTGFTSVTSYGEPGSPPWYGFCPAPFTGSPNYLKGVRAYTVSTLEDRMILYIDGCSHYRGGFHLGAPDRASRWQIGSVYTNAGFQFLSLPITNTIGLEIFLVDTTIANLGPYPNPPATFNHGTIRRLAQHRSCHNCTTGEIGNSTPEYYKQPQAAIGSSLRRFFFRSTMGGTYPSGFIGNIPSDVAVP